MEETCKILMLVLIDFVPMSLSASLGTEKQNFKM
jgi:hypothetical protein